MKCLRNHCTESYSRHKDSPLTAINFRSLVFYKKLNTTDAKNFTRQQFDKNSKESDQEKIKDLLKVADQAAIIIERNLVQGIKNKDSVFSLQLNAAKEMNDNASIKSAKKQPAQKI